MVLYNTYRSIVTIQLLCCYVSSQGYTVRDTQCLDETKCYNLHDGEVTWDQAASYCQSINQRLAVILDQDSQDVISRFAGSGTGDDRFAWVGGRRSSSTMWRNVEGGTLQTQEMIKVLPNGTRWCSAIRVATFAADQGLFALPCSDSNFFRALCECPEVTECKTSPLYNVSSKCHTVSSSRFYSWESARVHCESLCQSGRLAFSVINQQHGALFAPNYGTDIFFWIGFHRRAWVWLAMQGEIVLSSFRYWLPGEGIGEETECMMVDFRRIGSWRDIKCDVFHNKFICEFNPRTTTTTLSLTTSTRTSERITHLTTELTLDQTSTNGVTTTEIKTEQTTDNASMPCASVIAENKVLKGIIGLLVALTCVVASAAIILGIRMRSLTSKQTDADPSNHDYYNMGPASVNVTQATPSETRSDIGGDYLTTASGDTRIHTSGDVLDYESTEDPDRPYGILDGNMRDPPEVSSPTYAALQ